MKRIIALCMVLGLVLIMNTPAFAGKSAAAHSKEGQPAISQTLNQIIEGAWNVQKVGIDTPRDFLLFQNLEPCLDKCQNKFESCMDSAGDDPTKKFRCKEQRSACTLGCDDQYYDYIIRTELK